MTEKYYKYRPRYNTEVCQAVIDYLKAQTKKSKFDLMLDVGCGAGQSSIAFSHFFKKVVAIDSNEIQISEARINSRARNITYKVGKAESLDVADNSVDLIVSASAVHFFDIPQFLIEAKRALKPGGCLALFGYMMPVVVPMGFKGDMKTRRGQFLKLVQDLLGSEIRERWSSFQHVADKYQGILERIPWSQKTRVKDLSMELDWTVDQLSNFFYSLDLIASYNKKKFSDIKTSKGQVTDADKQKHDVVKTILQQMKKMCGLSDVADKDMKLSVTFEVFMLLSQKPTD